MNVILHYAAEATESDHHGASRQSAATFVPYLSEPTRSLMQDRFPTGEVLARGATVGKNNTNKTQWDKIVAGDLALFLRDNTVIGSGEVVFKVQNAELSWALGWKEKKDSGLPFELIYTVTNVTQLNLPRKGLLEAVGYSPKTDQVGFRVLELEKARRATTWLEEHAAISKEDLHDLMRRLLALEQTDGERVSLFRKEQLYWRQWLFKQSQNGECAACRSVLPVELLVAAHIKRRSDCSHEERIDPNNLIPLCLLGCDALFERGYFSVGQDGYIRVREVGAAALRKHLNALSGHPMGSWSPERTKYFESRLKGL